MMIISNFKVKKNALKPSLIEVFNTYEDRDILI